MGIKILWEDRDKTVMRQVYEGRWSVDDFRQVISTTHKLLNGLPHTVDIIMDATLSDGTPSNILAAMRYAEQQVAPNQGRVVVIGADLFMQEMLAVAKRIAPRATGNTTLVDTLEDARVLVGQTKFIPA